MNFFRSFIRMRQALRGLASCATRCPCCQMHRRIAQDALDNIEGFMKYALIVQSKEVRYHDNSLAHANGARFWVLKEPEGWVKATSTRVHCNGLGTGEIDIPSDILVFESEDAAAAFAKSWEGHPWWCQPNGTFEIVPVVPNIVPVQKGWLKAPVGESHG